jgi:PIN domain nuclease of toxin-antitoxin system
VWEIAIKHALHPDNVAFTGKELAGFCKEAGFLPLEVRDRHVFALETLSRPADAPRHNDPFDRMLIAQAKAENMVFLTHDSLIPYYGEQCIMPV